MEGTLRFPPFYLMKWTDTKDLPFPLFTITCYFNCGFRSQTDKLQFTISQLPIHLLGIGGCPLGQLLRPLLGGQTVELFQAAQDIAGADEMAETEHGDGVEEHPPARALEQVELAGEAQKNPCG